MITLGVEAASDGGSRARVDSSFAGAGTLALAAGFRLAATLREAA
jgi:hypothetical protein